MNNKRVVVRDLSQLGKHITVDATTNQQTASKDEPSKEGGFVVGGVIGPDTNASEEAVPSWAWAMVGSYRTKLQLSDAITDKMIFDAAQEMRGANPEEIEQFMIDRFVGGVEDEAALQEWEAALSDDASKDEGEDRSDYYQVGENIKVHFNDDSNTTIAVEDGVVLRNENDIITFKCSSGTFNIDLNRLTMKDDVGFEEDGTTLYVTVEVAERNEDAHVQPEDLAEAESNLDLDDGPFNGVEAGDDDDLELPPLDPSKVQEPELMFPVGSTINVYIDNGLLAVDGHVIENENYDEAITFICKEGTLRVDLTALDEDDFGVSRAEGRAFVVVHLAAESTTLVAPPEDPSDQPSIIEQHFGGDELIPLNQPATIDPNEIGSDGDKKTTIVLPETVVDGVRMPAVEVPVSEGVKQLLEEGSDDAEPVVTREMLLEEIKQFLPPGSVAQNTNFEKMTDVQLQEHLYLLKIHNGGSVAAHRILQEIEADYQKLVNSPDVIRRLALLETKGAEFLKLAQKMSRIMGNDVTVRGLRYEEYHTLLNYLTRSVSVVFHEITAAADEMGIKMPIEELMPYRGSVPIIEGMPIDERTAMYILRALRSSLEHWYQLSLTLRSNLIKAEAESADLKRRLETVTSRLNTELEEKQQTLDAYEKRFVVMDHWFIKVSGGNGFVALKDEEAKLSLRNLTFTQDIRDSMLVTSRRAAERIVEAMMENPRFDKFTYSVHRLAAVAV